jgi:hypothetical protein
MAHKPPTVLHGVPVEFLYAPRPWNYSAQCHKPPVVVPPRCSLSLLQSILDMDEMHSSHTCEVW